MQPNDFGLAILFSVVGLFVLIMGIWVWWDDRSRQHRDPHHKTSHAK